MAGRTAGLSLGTPGAARALLLGCLALALGGCVDEEREKEIGSAMAADVNVSVPLVRDPVLNAYLSGVGRLVARVSERPGLDYHFFLVNSASVNAFALPGGYIYVTRGLIEQTRTPDELAAVLAHEVGHVAARHGVDKLQRYLRTGSLVGFLYTVMLGGEPALLRQNALQLTGKLWSASHSREDEQQADRLGVEYLLRAGIHPRGMVTLLETLLREEPRSRSELAAWFSSHPLTAARLQEARETITEQMAEDHPPARTLSVASYPAFQRRLAELPPPPDQP